MKTSRNSTAAVATESGRETRTVTGCKQAFRTSCKTNACHLLLCITLSIFPVTAFSQQTPRMSIADMTRSMALMKRFQQEFSDQSFNKAEQTLKEFLPLAERIYGRNSPELVRMEVNRGTMLRALGRLDEAKIQLDTALDHAKRRLGPQHAVTGVASNALGGWHQLKGDNLAAGNHFQNAVQILGNPSASANDRIDAIANFAGWLGDTGNGTAALDYTTRALTESRQKLGEQADLTLTLLNNLGMAQRSLGNLPAAEKTMRKSVAQYQEKHGKDHQQVGSSLQNLALVLVERGKYDEASQTYERAIRILQKELGPTHLTTLTAKANQGQLFSELGKHKLAEPLLKLVLRDRTELLGEDHPSVAQSKHNLGVHHLNLKNTDEAYRLFEAATENFTSSTPSRLGKAAVSRSWLGIIHGLRSDVDDAINQLGQATKEVIEATWNELPALASDKQRRFMIANYNPTLFTSLSLGFVFPENQSALAATAEWVANGKGIATEALAAARNNEAKTKRPWVTLGEIRDQIPEDGVWIDIVRQDHINYEGSNYTERLLDPQYVAWIVPKVGNVARVELGDADELDELVDTVREVMANATKPNGPLTQLAEIEATVNAVKQLAKMADRLWKPMEAKLPADTKQNQLSPNGALWLLPWNALPTGDEFLIQKYSLSTFVSGRNFVAKRKGGPDRVSPSAVFANPDFDQQKNQKAAAYKAVFRQAPPPPTEVLRVRSYRAFDPTNSRVSSLPGTAIEAQAIQPSMTKWLDGAEPVRYEGTYALESIAKRVIAPKALVFATHGFFQNDDTEVFDPLLKCGLLLAGCNDKDASTAVDDGVLTGAEITGLNLEGTELVVLSACETGIGKIENGNGIAGLRRAFHFAGAESVVSSLWQVPDYDTAKLMRDFFVALADGKSKAEAIRDAQVRRIESRTERNGAAHPFFWAGFHISGR